MGLLLLAEGGFMELANPSFNFLLLSTGEDFGIVPPVHTIENTGYVKQIVLQTGHLKKVL